MLDLIKNASVIIITAGAGMGVDSGLPDFRGKEGFWKEYPLLKNKNISFSEIANPQQFKENPELAWAFYGHRHDLYKETIPHEGFYLLLDLVKEKDYFVVTSNVDRQFQKAGFNPEKIYEIHGSIFNLQCSECDKLWKMPFNKKFNVDNTTLSLGSEIPYCSCGAIARPNIMMFMDFNFNSVIEDFQAKEFRNFLKEKKDLFDINPSEVVVIEIGAGTAIPSIRMIGEGLLKKGATLIRINPREAFGPKGVVSIEKGGLEGLKAIL